MERPAPIILLANVGMAVGAIAGASLRAYLQLLSLVIILLGRMLDSRRGTGQPAKRPDAPVILTPRSCSSRSDGRGGRSPRHPVSTTSLEPSDVPSNLAVPQSPVARRERRGGWLDPGVGRPG
jgi:hypothetical protein